MSTDGEYDGIAVAGCLPAGESVALNGTPEGADRVTLYHLCGEGDISAGLYKHTPVDAKAVMFDLTDKHGGRDAPTRPAAPDASRLGIDLTGAPDCLCVYRLACSKSITVQKNAKRAGLYPYTPQPAKDNGDPPKTVRSGALGVVDVERCRC